MPGHCPGLFSVLFMLHSIFFKQDGKARKSILYFPFTTVQTLRLYQSPLWAPPPTLYSPLVPIFPLTPFSFVNARCADLFKNITQVPGEPWCLPALQIKKIHLLICSVSICLLNWEWLLAVQTDTRAIWLRTTSLCTFPPLIWHNRPGAGRELSRCDRMSGGLPLYVRN